ncbi:MAG: CbtB-domain containing protein [Ardenticatenaceae bacterium]|nr:CbtB-domain containing protein [Ardenticatenaceae bacterium]
MYETHHEHQHVTRTLTLTQTMVVQAAIVLVVAAIVLWALLFANYLPLHDSFHALRHALYIIPCH